jgi:hypothetical protein
MLAFTARTFFKQKEERAGFGSAFDQAEATMTPKPSAAFQAAFAPTIRPRRMAAVQPRMDPSWPSASGARLALTTLGLRL